MRSNIASLVCVALTSWSAHALADDTKKECVEASTAGQTSRDAGELLDARMNFRICARDACPSVVKQSCSGWLSEVEEQLPSVVIRAADAANVDITDGKAEIDGHGVPLDGKPITLDPGKHLIVVDSSSGVHLEKRVLLAAGEKSRLIELRVKPEPGQAGADEAGRQKSGMGPGPYVLGGLGVVALGSFTYFALTAKKELTQLQTDCSPRCTDSQTAAGRRDALIADISLGVGLASLAGAVTWALFSSSSSETQGSASHFSVAATPRGGFASVSTAF